MQVVLRSQTSALPSAVGEPLKPLHHVGVEKWQEPLLLRSIVRRNIDLRGGGVILGSILHTSEIDGVCAFRERFCGAIGASEIGVG